MASLPRFLLSLHMGMMQHRNKPTMMAKMIPTIAPADMVCSGVAGCGSGCGSGCGWGCGCGGV